MKLICNRPNTIQIPTGYSTDISFFFFFTLSSVLTPSFLMLLWGYNKINVFFCVMYFIPYYGRMKPKTPIYSSLISFVNQENISSRSYPFHYLSTSLTAEKPPGCINQVTSTFARFHFQPNLYSPSCQSLSCHCFFFFFFLSLLPSLLSKTPGPNQCQHSISLPVHQHCCLWWQWHFPSGHMSLVSPQLDTQFPTIVFSSSPISLSSSSVFISFLQLLTSPPQPSLSAKTLLSTLLRKSNSSLWKITNISWALTVC